METIQVSKLKQYTNDVIADVEAGGGAKGYAVTVHGRDTGVVLVHKSQLRDAEPKSNRSSDKYWRSSTVEEIRASGMYSHLDERTKQDMLKMIEEGRDASGTIGDGQ